VSPNSSSVSPNSSTTSSSPAVVVDWTILRPGGLTDQPATHQVEAQERGIAGGRITRGDVAWFILEHCLHADSSMKYSGKALTLINK
jgi:hypothetical protein